MIKKPILILTIISFVLQSSCMSLGSLQSARSLKKNGFSFTGAFGTQTMHQKHSEDDLEPSVNKWPAAEVLAQYSPFDNLDLGLRIIFPASFGYNFKYTLINQKKFAFGFGLEYSELGSPDAPDSKEEDDATTKIRDITVPMFLTYDITNRFSIHLSPKIIKRKVTFLAYNHESNWVGATLGINFGGFMIEQSYTYDQENPKLNFLSQFTIGFWTGWDEVNRPSSIEKKAKKSRKKRRLKS